MIAQKACKAMHNLFRALTTKKPQVLLQAFESYVRPIMEYGTVVFNPHKKTTSDKLEKVQNAFTRRLLTRVIGFIYDEIPSWKERN